MEELSALHFLIGGGGARVETIEVRHGSALRCAVALQGAKLHVWCLAGRVLSTSARILLDYFSNPIAAFLWVPCPACRTTSAIDLRALDSHRDASVTSSIPALSCRSCRPNAPLAELVQLACTSIAAGPRGAQASSSRRVAGGGSDFWNAVMRNFSVICNAGSRTFRDGSTQSQIGLHAPVARYNYRQIGHKPLMLPAEWQVNAGYQC